MSYSMNIQKLWCSRFVSVAAWISGFTTQSCCATLFKRYKITDIQIIKGKISFSTLKKRGALYKGKIKERAGQIRF